MHLMSSFVEIPYIAPQIDANHRIFSISLNEIFFKVNVSETSRLFDGERVFRYFAAVAYFLL